MAKVQNPLSMLFLVLLLCLVLPAHGYALAGERTVIVAFDKRPGKAQRHLLQACRGRIGRNLPIINGFTARLPEEEIAVLRKSPGVRFVEEDRVVSLAEPEIGESVADSGWGVEHIGCPSVQGLGIAGEGIKVAVLDTGIDYTHPKLLGNYRGGYDFVFDDADPYDDSYNSHGTHVAGIIAASQDGGGVVGCAPSASLYGVKVLDGGGFGHVSFLVAGIDWAVDNGMDIANISIAGTDSAALEQACAAASAAGLLLVGAGGNTYGGDVLYPAAYETVLAVTASDQNDLPAYFSPADAEVELTAPGVDILSTTAGGGYGLLSGTSQAAPHLAGTAALMMSAGGFDVNGDGVADSLDIRLRLQESAVDLGEAGRDWTTGFGLVDAAAAVTEDGDVDGWDLLVLARRLRDGETGVDPAGFAASFGRMFL